MLAKIDLPFVIRKRPDMYIGGVDVVAVRNMLLLVVGDAFDQYVMKRCRNIMVDLDESGTFTVQDDGPGLPAKGSADEPPLRARLTRWTSMPRYYARAHLGSPQFGLPVVSSLSGHFEIETIHQGIATRARFSHGKQLGRMRTKHTTRASGTKVRFRPDPTIITWKPSAKLVTSPQLQDLVRLSPGLTWRLAGKKHEGYSLREHVARRAKREASLVAQVKVELAGEFAPIEVEVAIASPVSGRRPGIESFANYQRTDQGGTHTEGLFDGIGAFFGTKKRDRVVEALVASVSVGLASPDFSDRSRACLASPEARPAVAAATRCALEAWAARQPEAAATMRARLR